MLTNLGANGFWAAGAGSGSKGVNGVPEASTGPKLAFWLVGIGTALEPVPGANETFLEVYYGFTSP